MANKQQVIDLHLKNPTWDSVQIADELGCLDAYVRATFYRNGLKLPKCNYVARELYELGRACRAAGLTLADILDIGKDIKAV